MGVLHNVMPLDAEMRDWLEAESVAYPPSSFGRSATPREIKAAVSDLQGFTAEFNGGDTFSEVDIHTPSTEGPWTQLVITSRQGLDDPADFYFAKGWPEAIIPVLINLSRFTGPLVLIEDSGMTAVVITPSETVASIMSKWAFTNESASDA